MELKKFKIGQKVMVVKPTREEDRFKVGAIKIKSYNATGASVYEVEHTNGQTTWWHESRLELLPEYLQDKTLEEAERTVKAVRKAVEAIQAMGKACKETAEAMTKASEEFKQEEDKDKQIAELQQQVEDLKRELVHRPIVILPKDTVVNIRAGKIESYEPLTAKIKPQTPEI